MAAYCKECSISIFGEDLGDLAGISTEEDTKRGVYRRVMCEGCLYSPLIHVDHTGQRVAYVEIVRTEKMHFLIRAAGAVFSLEHYAPSLERIRSLLKAELLDCINLHNGHVMLIDDNGIAKGLPINRTATQIYQCTRLAPSDHEIFGDAVIMPNGDDETAQEGQP